MLAIEELAGPTVVWSWIAASVMPGPHEVAELAGRYQLPFAEPDWLPGIIERYGLNAPPRG